MIRARDLVAEIDAANSRASANVTTSDGVQAADSNLKGRPDPVDNYRFDFHSIESDTNALDALKIMAERGCCALLVMRQNQLVGLVTEQDYSRKVANQRRRTTTPSVAAIMSAPPEIVAADTTVEHCLEFANNKHVQYLCVVDGGEILGLISIADISRALVGHRERSIRNLTHYIVSESQVM